MQISESIELIKFKKCCEDIKLRDCRREVNDHIARYGYKKSEYIDNKKANFNYHRGKYEMCVEILNKLI